MLRQIKYKMNLTGKELAKFLEVSEATVYNWEKKDNWPSWAITKCGFTIESKESKIGFISGEWIGINGGSSTGKSTYDLEA